MSPSKPTLHQVLDCQLMRLYFCQYFVCGCSCLTMVGVGCVCVCASSSYSCIVVFVGAMPVLIFFLWLPVSVLCFGFVSVN